MSKLKFWLIAGAEIVIAIAAIVGFAALRNYRARCAVQQGEAAYKRKDYKEARVNILMPRVGETPRRGSSCWIAVAA